MKRSVAILFLALALASSLSAQLKAVVKEIIGKVEIKAADGVWRPAKVGAAINKGHSISTGFDSTAVLTIGQSTLRVRPLTRMRLEDLTQAGTSLSLSVGKVKGEVKKGGEENFTLRGPVSTAAVRGTEFEYDGFTVKVTNGFVTFENSLRQGRVVVGGEDGSIDGLGLQIPTTGDQEKDWRSQIDPYTSPTITGPSADQAGQMAHVIIRWQ
jgi:ferric-dicitrate binding protein FerR (iron transport regulator)